MKNLLKYYTLLEVLFSFIKITLGLALQLGPEEMYPFSGNLGYAYLISALFFYLFLLMCWLIHSKYKALEKMSGLFLSILLMTSSVVILHNLLRLVELTVAYTNYLEQQKHLSMAYHALFSLMYLPTLAGSPMPIWVFSRTLKALKIRVDNA